MEIDLKQLKELMRSLKQFEIKLGIFHLEIDHRNPWADCHETVLTNLDPLCDHDHDLKTHHGWALIEGTGKRPMVPPDDPRHPRNRPPP